MAGIGFELKKLFRRRGILAHVMAVGYTGVITTGPLILGLLYMLGVSWLGRASGVEDGQIEALLAMVMYAMAASQLINSLFSMVTTRYVSDMLYEERDERVVPSLVGALAIALPVGGVPYGAFLLLSGLSAELVLLNELLFLELVVVWLEMGYLTAVKDYKGVLGVYAGSIAASLVVGWLVCLGGKGSMTGLLASVCVGYGLMMALDLWLLGRSFPGRGGRYFAWLAWVDRYPSLVVIGLMSCVGLFAHLVLGWTNQAVSKHILGPFFSAPSYDIPALYATLSMLPTTVTFVATTEVDFYPAYRRYLDLLNTTGSISQIDAAQEDMLTVMGRELSRLARRQLFVTIAVVGIGTQVLDMLPLGFTPYMNQRFCILCVGYGAYAIANVLSLMLMYFSDYRHAAVAGCLFAGCVVATSLASVALSRDWLGYGFALSSMAYYLAAMIGLRSYLKRLPAAILLEQPLVAKRGEGGFSRLGNLLDGIS